MDILGAVYQPDKLTAYNLVLFLHVASTIVAFGVVFAYPLTCASQSAMHEAAKIRFPTKMPAIP